MKYLQILRPMARRMHFLSPSRRVQRRKWGVILTTLFSQTEIHTAAPLDAPPRKKFSWMPILVVLFCLSYGLLTRLVIEQGRTIDQQAALIHELFRDSTELATNKMKALQDRAAKIQAQKGQAPSSQAQIPSAQAPSAPAQNAPSSRVAPQHRAPAQNQATPQSESPSRPASDQSQDRRALVRI
jgi:hypothetical protein